MLSISSFSFRQRACKRGRKWRYLNERMPLYIFHNVCSFEIMTLFAVEREICSIPLVAF